MIIYMTGYSGKHHGSQRSCAHSDKVQPKLDAFAQLVARGFVICDVRLSPHSRYPYWRKNYLASKFGRAYRSIPNLGNERYQSRYEEATSGVARFVIRDWDKGLSELFRAIAETGLVALILCGCERECDCHRSELARNLRALGHVVIELPFWDEPFPMPPVHRLFVTPGQRASRPAPILLDRATAPGETRTAL